MERMICPYDQAQCSYPNCLFENRVTFVQGCLDAHVAAKSELTACIIKPDAFPKYAGEILSRLLGEKFRIILAGTVDLSSQDIYDLYDQHVGAPYYDNLKACMMAGSVFAMVLENKEAIRRLRFIMGPTKIDARHPGELRYEFGDSVNAAKNVIHGSDSLQRSFYEISLIKEWLRR